MVTSGSAAAPGARAVLHLARDARKKIADWAKLHEVEIVRWWEEIDQSGAKLERPLFQQALARCDAGETGGIVVAKLDRFARSAVDALGAIRRLNEAGAGLVSVEDKFDGSTLMGRFAPFGVRDGLVCLSAEASTAAVGAWPSPTIRGWLARVFKMAMCPFPRSLKQSCYAGLERLERTTDTDCDIRPIVSSLQPKGEVMRNRNLWRFLVGLAAFAIFNVPTAAASNGPPPDAKFTTEGSVAHPSARTIPWWSFGYTDPTNGVPYHISMVGSDPRSGDSTTVPTEIIPLKFNFVAGNQDMSVLDDYGGRFPGFRATAQAATFDGGSKVAETLASPIFSAYKYPTDLGGDRGVQYGDAFMRAQFNKIGSSYHVKLGQPTVLPTVTINVPQNQGVAYYRPAGALAGTINSSWFSGQIDNLMTSMHVDSQTLPIFLTDNVLLYLGSYLRCCVLGYHGATSSLNTNGNGSVQTFVYAAYEHPGDYPGFDSRGNTGPVDGFSDIHGLSHEVAEWLDDPFVSNAVQPWLTPTAPDYGCTGLLETGDPVVGVWFPLSGNPDPAAGKLWHPEDEVFLSWFARNGEPAGLSPWSSYYSFMGPRTVAIGGDYASWAQLPATC